MLILLLKALDLLLARGSVFLDISLNLLETGYGVFELPLSTLYGVSHLAETNEHETNLLSKLEFGAGVATSFQRHLGFVEIMHVAIERLDVLPNH